MSEKFVLVVSDENERKRGEISVLDTAHETERLVQTLLEAGFEQERIRVYTGSEAEFATTYRPLVSLCDEANQTTEPARSASDPVEPEGAMLVRCRRFSGAPVTISMSSSPLIQPRKVAIDRDAETPAGAAMYWGRLRGLPPMQMRDVQV